MKFAYPECSKGVFKALNLYSKMYFKQQKNYDFAKGKWGNQNVKELKCTDKKMCHFHMVNYLPVT